MGGYGSGQWREAAPAMVEDACVFDVAWLRARGALPPNRGAHGTSVWTYGAQLVGWINWETVTTDAPCVHLRYTVRVGLSAGRRIDERMALDATRPRFGGVRWWFRCPGCQRRSAKLYRPSGAARFRCRVCYRLAYACQREARPARLRRRANKLWRRIGCDLVTSPRATDKPRWMRRRTYWRIRAEADRLDWASLAAAFEHGPLAKYAPGKA